MLASKLMAMARTLLIPTAPFLFALQIDDFNTSTPLITLEEFHKILCENSSIISLTLQKQLEILQ